MLKENSTMKRARYFKSDPRKAPHLYDETLSVKNWRKVYKTKFKPYLPPTHGNILEQFIERLLLNTIKQAKRGNLDDMFDAV